MFANKLLVVGLGPWGPVGPPHAGTGIKARCIVCWAAGRDGDPGMLTPGVAVSLNS